MWSPLRPLVTITKPVTKPVNVFKKYSISLSISSHNINNRFVIVSVSGNHLDYVTTQMQNFKLKPLHIFKTSVA